MKLALVGVGLIGGSVALAARSRGLAHRIVGVDRDAGCRNRALSLSLIDEAAADLDGVAGCDTIVFCTPVDVIARQALEAASLCPAGALLTDTGSTKGQIVREVEKGLPAGVSFVGAHPLAGSEKHGPEHADRDLFQGRLTVLTPTRRTPAAALERAVAFWQALGSRVRVMDCDEHDRALALTSHLPHLAASALAGILPAELYELTASGFRDTTRLASASPELWTAICQQNRTALLEALGLFGKRLEEFRQALESGDSERVGALLAQGRKVKQDLGRQPL
jgi:prephenate dehydrogenase